ncbi:unnamed protein product [Echinostoma caproni]|uniref:ZM domain-containing protein n=1 Tax=Echinostoma caproni TaxID=27848 RepID=A0A183APU6_9TREM|nr:unnamed protein product [Echinostoma caproni]
MEKRPTLWQTNMEILKPGHSDNQSDGKLKGNAAHIVPLPPLPQSTLELPPRYGITPHLTNLTQAQKDQLDRNRPPILEYDSWARIPYAAYHLPVSPVKLHTESLSHATYTDPLPGRLPPLIYK